MAVISQENWKQTKRGSLSSCLTDTGLQSGCLPSVPIRGSAWTGFTFTESSEPIGAVGRALRSTAGPRPPPRALGTAGLLSTAQGPTQTLCRRAGQVEEQDLRCPSQVRLKPQLPGFRSSPAWAGVLRLRIPRVAADCVARGAGGTQDAWGPTEAEGCPPSVPCPGHGCQGLAPKGCRRPVWTGTQGETVPSRGARQRLATSPPKIKPWLTAFASCQGVNAQSGVPERWQQGALPSVSTQRTSAASRAPRTCCIRKSCVLSS